MEFYFDFDCQAAHSVADLIGRAHSIDTNQLDAVVDSNRWMMTPAMGKMKENACRLMARRADGIRNKLALL